MQSNQKIVIRSVAFVTAITALFGLLPGLRSFFYFWISPFQHFSIIGPFYGVLGLVMMVIPVLKLVVAFGLFKSKRWAWFGAIAVLTADFVLRAAGAIAIFLIAIFVPIQPAHPMAEGTLATVIPLWPSYVIAIISIASVLALIQKPIKNLFAKSKFLPL